MDTCAICLEEIADRALASPCQHSEFDYECLKKWALISATCPICKGEIQHIIYNIQSDSHFDVLACFKNQRPKRTQDSNPFHLRSRIQRSATLHNEAQLFSRRSVYYGRAASKDKPETYSKKDVTSRRRLIYDKGVFGRLENSNRWSPYRNLEPIMFKNDISLILRAEEFLQRELSTFSYVDQHSIEFITALVIAVLKEHDIDSEPVWKVVAEFFDTSVAKHIVHELALFLKGSFRSPDIFYNCPQLVYDGISANAGTSTSFEDAQTTGGSAGAADATGTYISMIADDSTRDESSKR